ncbi:GntR family transcriptional regulator [Granulicella cerasi]|uniref:GntR family transcriptional regulator n=1 Tax=Granulicella cerasi TaxID=741063 RepID=A0ABW1ZAQ4_9BACT|nr:GntR family transcriptional regulator [Granulicella cerasi]
MSIDAPQSNGSSDFLRKPLWTSLADNIANLVANSIATRRLMPGERIVETTLAEKLGVSRVPIREALKVLHAQGILTGGGHRGYHVATFDAETTQQILEVRLMLETFLLRDALANWRSGLEDPNELNAAIAEMERAAKSEDIPGSLLADLEFHRIIRNAAHNPIAGTLWDTIARHVTIVFNFERYRDKNLMAIPKQHEQFRDFIFEQIKNPGPDEVIGEAMESHILLIDRQRRKFA